MVIKAIETRYAGCRFRSRLEARWAVFLNYCQIEWQYEPGGINVQFRRGSKGMNWLPDFTLETGHYVEVKGSLDSQSQARLLLLASEVARCEIGHDVVILGHIPKDGSARWPVQLHSHDGLWMLPWDLFTGCPLEQPRPRIALQGVPELKVRDFLLEGMINGEPDWAAGGLDKARCARFEWGESG